jgi:hypothetical protein
MDWETDSDDSSDEDVLKNAIFQSVFAVAGVSGEKAPRHWSVGPGLLFPSGIRSSNKVSSRVISKA